MASTSARLVAAVLSFGLGLGLGACRLPNPDHCFNIAADPDAWCSEVDPDRGYCSPCEADNNGCVAEPPDPELCPEYTTPGTETGVGSETGMGSETG